MDTKHQTVWLTVLPDSLVGLRGSLGRGGDRSKGSWDGERREGEKKGKKGRKWWGIFSIAFRGIDKYTFGD